MCALATLNLIQVIRVLCKGETIRCPCVGGNHEINIGVVTIFENCIMIALSGAMIATSATMLNEK